MTIVTQDDAATAHLAASMERFLHGLAPAESWEHLLAQVPQAIGRCVEEMERLVTGHDAFDVLAMARQYCLPVFKTHRESTTTTPYAIVDVIALVLLGHGLPTPAEEIEPSERTAAIIQPLCSLAHEVLRIAMLASSAEASRLPDGLGELVHSIKSFETQVRGRQYPSIAVDLNTAILGHPVIEELMLAELGYSYADVHTVGAAITGELSDRYISAQDDLHRAAASGASASVEEAQAGRAAAEALLLHPSRLHLITYQEATALSGVDAGRVESIMNQFSTSAEVTTSTNATTLVQELVNGKNAMAGRAAVRRASGEYLVLADAVPEDEIRSAVEALLKKSSRWKTYERRRAAVAEDLAGQNLARLLGLDAPTHTNLKYLIPRRGAPSSVIAADATREQLRAQAEVTEADALLVVDQVAVCLEVKAGNLPAGARRGHASALSSGLKRTVVGAADQAQRLRQLITKNGGIWTEGHAWIDLSEVREVHLVVVCLDDLGPLAVAGDALVKAGLMTHEQRAWITSLHDLIVVGDILRQPAQFLAYLRRRTETETARWLVAVDELDVLMYFVQGSLYFEPDPEVMHRCHPGSRPPTVAALRRFRRQSRTRIGTLTDDLDSWMTRSQGDGNAGAQRPQRAESDWVQAFLELAREKHLPGWLSLGADLVGLSGPAQDAVGKSILATVRRAAADGQPHNYVQGTVSPWGYWLLMVHTANRGDVAAEWQLRQHLAAKKHQLMADRALGLLLDREGHPLYSCLLNAPWQEDAELDAVVAASRLFPSDRAAAVLPPAARRRRLGR